MSVESPESGPAALETTEPSHGGPVLPWETILEGRSMPRSELARELVERGHAPTEPAAVDMIDAASVRGEVSVDGRGCVVAASRQSNLNKSVNRSTAEKPASESDGRTAEERIGEKVSEFAAAYPMRATMPLAERDGTRIRRDYAEVEYEEWTEIQPDEPEYEAQNPAKGANVSDVSAVEWGEAVRRFLESVRRTEETTINLQKAHEGHPEYAEFSVSAENRWFASYQKKYFGQLDGWLRGLCGGERPSGGESEGLYENPKIALITRSASSTPEGERVGPVEHAEELRDSWEPVYHTLRNTLRSLGYSLGEEWQYDRRLEPHTGKRGNRRGVNAAYAHEHIVLVVDGDVTAGDLRPVIEKHVEACEWAGEEAHGEEAIEVREPSELNDVAAYVADYCSIDPVSIWERGPAYVGWAAAMTAGNVRTMSRSESSREVARVDACRQRGESEEAEQEAAHGERVARVDGEIVCCCCGLSWGIDQEQTLTSRRLESSGPAVVSDGGREVMDAEAREEELRERWPSAEAAAVVGETPGRKRQREEIREAIERRPESSTSEIVGRLGLPPDAREVVAEVRAGIEREEVVGYDEPEVSWFVESIEVDGEEHPPSPGNGIDMVAVTDVRERLREGAGVESEGRYRCECGVAAYGSDFVGHLLGHGIEEAEIAAEVVREESM